MFSVLLVEDEMLVRLGLKNSIDWSRFNMKVIADAADGNAAWDIYQKEKPDLIITDLKMPVMDGMKLIAKIREKDKKTRIIILSCLEEFGLAQKAIALGVSDYILKLTMTGEEIEAVLKKSQEELGKWDDAGRERLSEDLKQDVFREKFLKDYIFYKIYSLNEFASFIDEAGLRLKPGRLILCLMEIDHFEKLQVSFEDEQGHLIKSTILNLINEIMGNYNRGEAFCDNDRNYVLIFSFSDITSEQKLYTELNLILNDIVTAINSYLNVYVSFGISNLYNGYSSLEKMYRESHKALEQKYFSGAGIFLSSTGLDFEGVASEKINALRQLPKTVKILGESAVREYLGKIDSFMNMHPKTREQIQAFFYHLIQWLSVQFFAQDDDPISFAISFNKKIEESETLNETIEIFTGFAAETAQEVLKKRILSKEVAKALKYIQLNYASGINLPEVAAYVQLSPNYLSKLLKKELQINFTEYLNGYRIEKAKELLLGTYLKSYEIAEKVGFAENTYFCRVFKKVTGYSPNEFRIRLMKEWTEEMDNENNRTI